MKIETEALDRQFGLMAWHGFPLPRDLSCSWLCGHSPTDCECHGRVRWNPTSCIEEKCIQFCDTETSEEVGCTLVKGRSICTDKCEVWEFKSGRKATGVTTPPRDMRKLSMLSKALVVNLYQGIVERFGIARALRCDAFSEMLGDCDGDSFGLNNWECKCWNAFPDGYFGHFRDSVDRHLAALLGGKISQGEFARKTIDDIIRFVIDAAMNDNLYPPTMLGEFEDDCMIPDPERNVTNTGCWRNREWFEVKNCRPEETSRLIARWFGFSDNIGIWTKWTNDMSMRSGIENICIPPEPCYTRQSSEYWNKGYFFGDLLKQLTADMEVADDVERVLTFVSCFSGYYFGEKNPDISGKYSCLFQYHRPDPRWRCVQTQLIRKHYAAGLGYGQTVAGGFGQNVALFRKRELEIKLNRVNAGRVIGVRAHVCRTDPVPPTGVVDCSYCDDDGFHCIIHFGGCKKDESFTFGFEPYEREAKHFHRTSEYTDIVTADARVDGYGAALPWVGGERILYPMGYNCGTKDASCYDFQSGEVPLESILKDPCNDLYTHQELVVMEGSLRMCLNAEWLDTCSDRGLCVRDVCYCDNYPSRQVLLSPYKDFVRNVGILYALRNSLLRNICGDEYWTCNLAGVEFDKDVVVNYCVQRNTWAREPIIDFLIRLNRYVLGRINYWSAGWYHRCASRDWGSPLPDGVRVVKRFPVTERDVWCSGDNSLLDPRPAEDFYCMLNDPDNIMQDGYWAVTIIFGEPRPYSPSAYNGFGIQPIEAVFTDYWGSTWRGELDWVEIEEHDEYGFVTRRLKGWRIGYVMWEGNLHSCYGRWEPYRQPCVDRIDIGSPFGFVRWDFKAFKRVPIQ